MNTAHKLLLIVAISGAALSTTCPYSSIGDLNNYLCQQYNNCLAQNNPANICVSQTNSNNPCQNAFSNYTFT